MSVRSHISKTITNTANFTKCSVHVCLYPYGSVLLWRHCDKLYVLPVLWTTSFIIFWTHWRRLYTGNVVHGLTPYCVLLHGCVKTRRVCRAGATGGVCDKPLTCVHCTVLNYASVTFWVFWPTVLSVEPMVQCLVCL